MTSDEPDDRQLLDAHLSGDPDAFGLLFSRYRERLWAVALRTTGDREEAADAVQDALVSALRGAARFRGEAAVSTWLHRIVVNACIDRLRRRAVRPTVPLAEGQEPPRRPDAGAPDRADTRVDLRRALARLPEQQRLALVLVDVEDLPVAEVAELLGVPEGTVKSRCARARIALARVLGESYRARGGNPAGTAHVEARTTTPTSPAGGEQ